MPVTQPILANASLVHREVQQTPPGRRYTMQTTHKGHESICYASIRSKGASQAIRREQQLFSVTERPRTVQTWLAGPQHIGWASATDRCTH